MTGFYLLFWRFRSPLIDSESSSECRAYFLWILKRVQNDLFLFRMTRFFFDDASFTAFSHKLCQSCSFVSLISHSVFLVPFAMMHTVMWYICRVSTDGNLKAILFARILFFKILVWTGCPLFNFLLTSAEQAFNIFTLHFHYAGRELFYEPRAFVAFL